MTEKITRFNTDNHCIKESGCVRDDSSAPGPSIHGWCNLWLHCNSKQLLRLLVLKEKCQVGAHVSIWENKRLSIWIVQESENIGRRSGLETKAIRNTFIPWYRIALQYTICPTLQWDQGNPPRPRLTTRYSGRHPQERWTFPQKDLWE